MVHSWSRERVNSGRKAARSICGLHRSQIFGILVILPSTHSPIGLIMGREDSIMEWIFLAQKRNKKFKTYTEKASNLIIK